MLETFLVVWIAGTLVMSIDYTINQKKALDNVEVILLDILSKLENSFDMFDYKQVHKFTIEFYQKKEFNVFKHLVSSLFISSLTWPLALLSSLVDGKEHSRALLKQTSFNFLIVYIKALAIFIKTKNIKMKGDIVKDHLEKFFSNGKNNINK